MKILRSEQTLGKVVPNIATLLRQNSERFSDRIVFYERNKDKYSGTSWVSFYEKINCVASNLRELGFRSGGRMLVYSPNRLEMLILELAVMSSGGISVPLFAWFKSGNVRELIEHSGAKYMTVAGQFQLDMLAGGPKLENLFVFDDITDNRFDNLVPFAELMKRPVKMHSLNFDAGENDVCLNMYTSGTMGVPKCVQLTHRNILSQQAGLEKVWNLDENDRFLSYLPWHHSFGGIFERFSALYSGASMYLESGLGKDPDLIFENWKKVQPTVFFSVPKVYQALVERTRSNKQAEELFFHSGLKFIFTAAASLPTQLSDEFEKRNIPVMEGWGLTETSPCCTITNPDLKRIPGVVGLPIPGVELRLANDGEIQVKGPNVMKGYFNNDEANKNIFTNDGWYCTGDIGDFTETGLKLISRKDRIFKLTNGEKVIPVELESIIQTKCHYLTYAMVIGGGKEYPVAILFPNKTALENPNYETSPEEGCFCPRSINELGKCLQGCLHDANCGLSQKFSKIKYAMVIDDELSIEKSTLTPSMKIAPGNVAKAYKAHIENMYGSDHRLNEEVYIVKLDTANPIARKIKV